VSRRTARLHAFYLIFQYPFNEPPSPDEAISLHIDNWFDPAKDSLPYKADDPGYIPMNQEDREFMETLYKGALENREEIDRRIEDASKGWGISRLNTVDAALLRLASYEIIYTDMPITVAINEVVELAKLFGSDESPAFVNGALRTIAQGAGRLSP
jgi:N utilization substance protein B